MLNLLFVWDFRIKHCFFPLHMMMIILQPSLSRQEIYLSSMQRLCEKVGAVAFNDTHLCSREEGVSDLSTICQAFISLLTTSPPRHTQTPCSKHRFFTLTSRRRCNHLSLNDSFIPMLIKNTKCISPHEKVCAADQD